MQICLHTSSGLYTSELAVMRWEGVVVDCDSQCECMHKVGGGDQRRKLSMSAVMRWAGVIVEGSQGCSTISAACRDDTSRGCCHGHSTCWVLPTGHLETTQQGLPQPGVSFLLCTGSHVCFLPTVAAHARDC
jgi:hypothetical protein